MSWYTSEAFTAGVLLACLWAVLCRMAMLAPARRTIPVAIQLFALGMGLIGCLLLPGAQGRAALSIGLAMFLALGAPRWRFSAPGSLGSQPDDSTWRA